jgi:hypothetical protein
MLAMTGKAPHNETLIGGVPFWCLLGRARMNDEQKSRILGEAVEFHRRLSETAQTRQQRKKRELETQSTAARRAMVFDRCAEPAALCRMPGGRDDPVRDVEVFDSNRAFDQTFHITSKNQHVFSLFSAVQWAESGIRGLLKRPIEVGSSSSLVAHWPGVDRWFMLSISGIGPDQFLVRFVDVTALKNETLRAEADRGRMAAELAEAKEAAVSPEAPAAAPEPTISIAAAAAPVGSRRRGSAGRALTYCEDCKRILDEREHWMPFDTYMGSHADVRLNRSMCPYCKRRNFPEGYGKE